MFGSQTFPNILKFEMTSHRTNKMIRSDQRKRQKGVVTLVTAVVLMLAVFSISFFVSEIIINEKQSVSNDLRGKQAFFAAQSGLDFARTLGDDTSSCSSAVTRALSTGSFSVNICVASGATELYAIESRGVSNDGSVERILSMATGRLPADITPPKVPIVAKGGLGITGNVKAINNYENLTVWSGSDFGVQGSANTYISLDGNKNQLSTIKNPGAQNIFGPDVLTNDPNLSSASADEIVQSFFGVASIGAFSCPDCGARAIAETGNYDVDDAAYYGQKYTYYSDGDATFDKPRSGTIPGDVWNDTSDRTLADLQSEVDTVVTGNVNLTGSNDYIGTPENPVLIVVNGTLTFSGSPIIFGTVIANKVRFGGAPTIFGGMVVLSSDSDAVGGGGGANVIMDKTTVDNVFESSGYGPVRSSWRDWEL